LNETRDDKTAFDMSFIKSKGFEKADIQNDYWGDGYEFSNSNGCLCYLYFKGKGKQKVIFINIDGISSNGWYGSIGMLYRCMDEISSIAKELRELKGNLQKQEKINELAGNSIHTWLKTILQNQPYSYYTTTYKNKITLSVKLKNRAQLDIPLYFKNFQKIMPDLLPTIQQFEKTANESKLRVLINNSSTHQQWTTPNSKL
jgi:hypothetical protein